VNIYNLLSCCSATNSLMMTFWSRYRGIITRYSS